MLFSQNKERENRFITALKITLPIILLILYFILNFEKELSNDVLFVILIFVYVYYVVYLIYLSFKTSLLDSVTNTFKRDKIYQIIVKNKNCLTILFGIKNYSFIVNHYGIDNAGIILKNFIIKVDEFLQQNGYKNVPIGTYSHSHFLMCINEKSAKLRHILTILEKKLINSGINNVEIKLNFAIVSSENKKLEQILWQLNEQIYSKKSEFLLNYDEKYKNIRSSIDKSEFVFKYQQMQKFDENSENLNTVWARIKIQNSLVSKQKITNVINKSGYELQFDKQMIKSFFENQILPNGSFIIEISAICLRNISFRNFIFSLINDGKIDAHRLILEFSEDEIYGEMKRFSEIMVEFKNIGIRFALGRFGGDNASFVYLKHLNIDFIIFDIEISKNLDNEKYLKIVEIYSQICKNLGIKTLIKFIDNKENFEKINVNIDYIGGFYISKPKNLKGKNDE